MDNKNFYVDLGKRLANIRDKKKLTQRKIAESIGVTFQQYQKYENGTNRIPTKALVIFSKLTNCDIRELIGMSINDYDNIYKENIVHNYHTTYINNYNGLFSNLFNIDLSIVKNRIVVSSILIGIVIYFIFDMLKRFDMINAEYNSVLLSFQFLVFLIILAILMFVVFSYSWLTYIITYMAYIGIIASFYRIFYKNTILLNQFPYSLLLDGISIFLVFITFLILKKLKISQNGVKK